ncbi:hypothetical protein NE865_14529 [Phthorimaea operculella]|nr:hypothetical protein NE865_14529 [Phthorimaea operculella]
MTLFVNHVVVILTVLNVLVFVNSSPFSTRDVLNIFGNPVKDLVNNFSKEVGKNKTRGEDNPVESMINVPENTENRECKAPHVKDMYGVCREPW